MSEKVIIVLSTGRCGTQWLADRLGQAASINGLPVHCEHEPANNLYKSAFYLSSGGVTDLAQNPSVERHLERIEGFLQHGVSYVETGWPAYAYVPLMRKRFPGRLRLACVYREPISWAKSMARHRMFSRSDWVKDHIATPSRVPNQVGSWAGEDWDALEEVEKCLFHWTQLNRFFIDLADAGDEGFPFIRFKDLVQLTEPTANKLFDSFDVGITASDLRKVDEGKIDRFPNKSVAVSDLPKLREKYVEVTTVWEALIARSNKAPSR